MGRRKKEPEHVHCEAIAAAAERLFLQKGIQGATMDDIAKAAGYSKATLYVYFGSKEALVGFLTLKGMALLRDCLTGAMDEPAGIRQKYNKICMALTNYQKEYPLYCSLSLGEINVDFERENTLPVEKELYETGEEINRRVAAFIREGIEAGAFQPDIPVLHTVFLFWSALTGLIQIAASKGVYLEQALGCPVTGFLEFGFERLYRMIAIGGKA